MAEVHVTPEDIQQDVTDSRVPTKKRTVEDDFYELISPSSAILSSYTHDEGEGLRALEELNK